MSKLQQYEAINQKTLKFTVSFLVFWIDLVVTAETLWQKQHHDTFPFPFSSKRSLREMIKLSNLEGMGKNNAHCKQTHHEVQETMGTKTDLATIALVGLKLIERHSRKHAVPWGWLVAEIRHKTVARPKALLTLIVGPSFKEPGKPLVLSSLCPLEGVIKQVSVLEEDQVLHFLASNYGLQVQPSIIQLGRLKPLLRATTGHF